MTDMYSKHFKSAPLAAAIAAALVSPLSIAQDEGAAPALEEVVVTARKRSESIMDIPASVQALSEDDLKEMGAKNIADYVRFLPAVTVVDYGAGVSTVVFRGATTSAGYVGESTSSVYMDEISLTTSGQQPSIRMVDIERVESLEGPQGTLYGSDAQAGTLRIITNKPKINERETVIDVLGKSSSEGEASYDGSIVFNVPLVEDKLAARFVAFKAKDGGFIDNVLGKTITNDLKSDATYGRSPSGWGTIDNSDVVADDINDYNVQGWRAAVKWDINEAWSGTLTHINQTSTSGSYSGFDPNVGDLETIRYNKEFYDVDYDISSLVVEGDLGFAQLVSATSYYNSDSEFNQDVTNYHKSYSAYYCIQYSGNAAYYAPYYFAVEGGWMYAEGKYCNAPTVEGDYLAAFYEDITYDRFSQEIRLSGETETFDWLVGAFYEESSYGWIENFGYPTANENGRGTPNELYQQTVSLAWNEWFFGESFPNARENWYANSDKDTKQLAIFGNTTWRLSEQWDLTLGARYFDRENKTTYFEEHPTGNLDADPNSTDGITRMLGEDAEFVPKVALSFKPSENDMIYGLWTIGYRPGGTNRQRGNPAFPQQYDTDKMTNYEFGYKGTFANDTASIVLTGFMMEWQNYQFELVDPSTGKCPDGEVEDQPGICGQPYQVGVYNAGDASINGVYIEMDWNPSSQLNVGFNAEWLDAKTDTDLDVGDLFVESGTQLPLTPDVSGGLWATYNWPVSAVNANGYMRVQWSYSGERSSQLQYVPMVNDDGSFNPYPQFIEPSYNIGDISMGLEGADWELHVFVNNVTNERAYYSHASQGGYTQQNIDEGRMHVETIYTNRPREYGIRFIKTFGD
jgi:iron complex outermembrane recepter protein